MLFCDISYLMMVSAESVMVLLGGECRYVVMFVTALCGVSNGLTLLTLSAK